MANQSYANIEDELDDERENREEPYSSITDREPLEDLSPEGRAEDVLDDGDHEDIAPSNPVKTAIMQRMLASAMPAKPAVPSPAPSSDDDESETASKDDYTQDPLMKQYLAKEKDLQGFRQAQLQSNQISNLGQAAAQAAQGANTPAPDNALFKNMQEQSKEMLKSNEEDVDRRQKVINAIEQRKSREQIAADNQASRESIAKANLAARSAALALAQGNKDASLDARINRNMGSIVNSINNDPIIKPSEQNLASLQKSKAILDNTSVPLTSQTLSDAEQDIASALTLRGMGAGEGKIRRTELLDLNRKISEVKLKWGNDIQDLRTQAPELVDQIKKMNSALIDDYGSTIKQRKNSIYDQYSDVFGDNDAFQSRIQKLRDRTNNPPAPGGMTAQDESTFPKQVKNSKTGQVATVSNPDELKEANIEGFQ